METKTKKLSFLPWLAALGLPALLVGLFYLLRGSRAVMDGWVFGVMAPVEQLMGRAWSIVPFSAAEVLTALFLGFSVLWLVRALALALLRRQARPLLHRLLALGAAWLWLWAGFCWMWNGAYYASSFSQRSGLEGGAHSPQELAVVTAWFAQNAARLSSQVQRDGEGHFAEDQRAYFQAGPAVYDSLTEEFPCLEMKPVITKPLLFSRLQSILGFTGVYFPFTGEANVNVDAPACLRPAVIAHEMAHQRMVASELEANFVGIAAAVTCDNVVYQYSGYLMGLIELSNALYSISPDTWQAVVQAFFTPELSTDWRDNSQYWAQLSSPVDDAAGQAYDAFLRGNGQTLGIQSYGACVDLLVSYFLPQALAGT